MKTFIWAVIFFILCLTSCVQDNQNNNDLRKINRKVVVQRHKILTTSNIPNSPAQVGNGEFAFGVDVTGLQTFTPFNTLSNWSWHSFPLPSGLKTEDFKGLNLNTHGRMIRYDIQNKEQPELSSWLAGNPHRFNLGRIGFHILKSDGTIATIKDLEHTRQEVDMWEGIIYSYFKLEGKQVSVKTACHPSSDAIAVSVISDLIKLGQIRILLDFPYPDGKNLADYLGDYDKQDAHFTIIETQNEYGASIARKVDDTEYYIGLRWTAGTRLLAGDTITSKHRFYINPGQSDKFDFTCEFFQQKTRSLSHTTDEVFTESKISWQDYWESGACIDLSRSKDQRWKELERRIVLSQYLMKVNEAGSLPPQESGLVNNGWYGRFHFEMIWWHGVHYALWNRWPLFDKSLHIYRDYLPTSIQRAAEQGYKGARWPKCTANFDRDWPHPIHALLIWQQPHPIYFAELDYRLHPSRETLEKWKVVVFQSAEFIADFAYFEEANDRYVLGPPIYIMSENTEPENTSNPCFELAYWRYGLRTAQIWRERLGLERDSTWDKVLNKLSPLPQVDGLYVTHENIEDMWSKFTFEHPGLIGTFGMLPGDGVDSITFRKTLDKVISTWDFNRTWGWDFPMVAMAAARTGNPKLAVDMLINDYPGFQFDAHGLATGGPFPYFPSNGGLLTAVAMMTAGWDGSEGDAPGFPKNGNWVVVQEGFNRMP